MTVRLCIYYACVCVSMCVVVLYSRCSVKLLSDKTNNKQTSKCACVEFVAEVLPTLTRLCS